MDYFKLFDIPVSFYPDTKQLARKMVELQKQNHPDYFVNADEHEKMNALTRSSEINQAYKVLTNRDRIVHYVLDQHGMIEEGEKYPLPSDFLMEIMEINEAKMDDAESASWQQTAHELAASLDEEIKPVLERYDGSAQFASDLNLVKDWYYKKKYLDRVLA